MPLQTVSARIRGFICVNAHPTGCTANVDAEVARIAQSGAPGRGMGDVLVVGSSTGYGLSSLLAAVFGYGARAASVCFERPPQGERTASAGWYNLAAAHRLARAAGRPIATVNGDAYTDQVKQQVLTLLKR